MKTILRLAGTALLLAGVAFGAVALSRRAAPAPGPASGGADLTCRMKVREKVITGAYKVYGLKDSPLGFWLAKSVFKNEGVRPVKELRVRYKLGEYADWCAWQLYPEVVPSQTVVDLYYPILSSKTAQLSSQTPAELLMEYEYLDSQGNKKQQQLAERLTMLGRREFFFSDLRSGERTGSFEDSHRYTPLLAAWVCSGDMPVSGLASLANKRAGGVGAGDSVEACIKAMRECYEIMRDIGITYQHPAWREEVGKSYDQYGLQSLQYPRETIEKRSGTCIDLAILYAAMLDSIGIEPVLVSLDGHCFPMGVNPKTGQFIPVEATCVGGPDNNKDFATANEIASKEYDDIQKSGRFLLIKPRECWAAGISQPELEPLPADILERWNIRGLVERVNRNVAAPAGNAPRVAAVTMAAGQWRVGLTQLNGTTSQGTATVTTQGQQVQLVYVGQYQMVGYDGLTHQAREQNTFVGTVNGPTFVGRCQQAVWTMDGQNVQPQGLPLVMNLTLSNNGRSGQGTVTGATGMTVQITMEAL